MRGCSPPITRADEIRYLAFRDIGCIACLLDDRLQVPAEAHHIVQDDNQQTLPLCPWHHRGAREGWATSLTTAEATALLGPSLAISKRSFEDRYGTEAELLENVNSRIQRLRRREVRRVACG